MKFVKGISPVIATIILVLIAVVAGVLLWLWTSGFTSALPVQQQALYERIKIEGVNVNPVNPTRKQVIAYVRNLGSVRVTISAVYILQLDGTVLDVVTSDISNADIGPRDIEDVTITIDVDTKYSSGYAYVIKVVTANGAEATYTFVWP